MSEERDKGTLTTTREKEEDAKKKQQPLSSEQEYVRTQVLSGKSCFLTGCGGTGKSFLTQRLISDLKDKYGDDAVAVTATTGIAACNINGVTLHSWAGIGLGLESAEDLAVEIMEEKQSVKERWQRTLCLVVDEISMLPAKLFKKLNVIACVAKQNELPFGGIQLLLVGDFAQLPPVVRKNGYGDNDGDDEDVDGDNDDTMRKRRRGNMMMINSSESSSCDQKKSSSALFCFETPVWRDAIKFQYELKKVFRQEDEEFSQLLSVIRMGECPPDIAAKLEATKTNVFDESNGIEPTMLFPTNAKVDAQNAERLHELEEPLHEYVSVDWCNGDKRSLRYLKDCPAKHILCLKPMAQVILLWNLDVEEGLANGTKGVFLRELSREEALDSLVDDTSSKYRHVNGALLVKFETLHHGTCTRVIVKQTFSVEVNGKLVASREQYPVKLSYALTIHKCQGMTITKAVMDLKKCHEFGQVYVALSRIKDLSGLKLIGFDPKAVKCHEAVKKYYGQFLAS